MRVVPKYKERVHIPEKYRRFLWDYPDGYAPLESFVLRVFKYGKFEDIKWIYDNYPDESYYVISTYPDTKRGVKYWIKRWKNEGE